MDDEFEDEEIETDEELNGEGKEAKEKAKPALKEASNIDFSKHKFKTITMSPELEERILKNKLKLITSQISTNGKMSLSSTDKQTLRKAKKFEKLQKEVILINSILLINKAKAISKAMSSSPLLYYVGIGALLIILIICVIAIVASTMPWLFPDENGDGTVNSMFGITGNDFYGARMVYRDDEKASTTIIEDYVELVEEGISATQTITSATATNGGETFDVTLTVNISLPSDDYDYSAFNEASFSSEYATLYNIVYEIAKSVYKTDNGADFSGGNLIECCNGILYFGYGDLNLVTPIISNMIISNTTYTSANDTENKLNQATDINPLIESKISALLTSGKYGFRAEKLFVKDYILTEADERISGIQKENYVAMIFMPKKNVTFQKISFAVGGNLTNLSMTLANNGSSISISSDGKNLGDETTQTYIYSTNNLNVSTNAFADIDSGNLNALSEGMSLFDIVENLGNYSVYLEQATSQNSVDYLTYKKNGVVLSLSNDDKFNLVEWETSWQSAS